MSISIKSSTISRLAGALAALGLCGAGPAWAGDGSDLASLNQLLSGTHGICAIFNMSSCPQLPSITQGVLQVAALGNSPPEIIAAQNSIAPGSNAIAGNPAAVLVGGAATPPLPLNSSTTPTLSDLLSTLTPLAFVSQKSGTAAATQLFDPKADAFLYAVGVSTFGQANSGRTDPDTAYFFYDDLFRNNQTFNKGQIVAKFSFPLTVLNNDGTENTAVMTTLQINAMCNVNLMQTNMCNGTPALQAQIISGFGATSSNPIAASQFGIQFALVFSASPLSTQKHAIFEVGVPLVVTGACIPPTKVAASLCVPPLPPNTTSGANTDPAYFTFAKTAGDAGPLNLLTYTAFGFDDLGFMFSSPLPTGVPAGAFSIGLAPTAVPFCTSTTCPPPPAVFSGPLTFSLCASLPDNSNGPGANLRPAVGAYHAIATDGETFLGAPLAPTIPSVCPAL